MVVFVLSLVNVGPAVLRGWHVTAILEQSSLLTSPCRRSEEDTASNVKGFLCLKLYSPGISISWHFWTHGRLLHNL